MHYLLSIMMRRHLITLFALFTGLAALHAPAHANSVESLISDVRALAGGADAADSDQCSCEQSGEEWANPCPAPEKQLIPARTPDVLRPPIVFGSERALE